MFELEKIVRKNILELTAYSSARDEFTGKDAIFLDANENPFGALNRYPDPQQVELKHLLAARNQVAIENIFIGNGSDEVISLAYTIFCTPGRDKALTFSPTYGMYDVSAAIHDVELIKLPLDETFQVDWEALDKYLQDELVKIIFICSPNNPTGNTIDGIDVILQKFKGLVVVDEAYSDFSNSPSYLSKLAAYPNLLVSQTFSKAWGLAAARVGVAYADPSIIALFNKVKPPYNVSGLNQQAACKALKEVEQFERNKEVILAEKAKLREALQQIPVIKKVFASDANFLLVEATDANRIYNMLVAQQVITRNRNSVLDNCIRITVGSPEENQALIKALKNIS